MILGHHSMKNKKSLESYSRDLQSGPLREYESCIASIRSGAFLPDQSRSGYFRAGWESFYEGPNNLAPEAKEAKTVQTFDRRTSMQALRCSACSG